MSINPVTLGGKEQLLAINGNQTFIDTMKFNFEEIKELQIYQS